VTRHQVLGLEAVLPTGEVIRTGGRFVKGSTGYDLTQLIIGSEGTLAIVTEALLGASLVLLGHVAGNESVGRVYSLALHLVNTFLLLASGRASLAWGLAILSCAVVILPTVIPNTHEQAFSPRDGSLAGERALALGWGSAGAFLAICYFVRTWSLAHDASVVFSQLELKAAFWISLSLTQIVPRIYRVWCTTPSATED